MLKPTRRPLFAYDGVHRPDGFGPGVELIHVGANGFLVRHGYVGAQVAIPPQARNGLRQLAWRRLPGFVPGVETDMIEGGLLKRGGDRMSQRVAKYSHT